MSETAGPSPHLDAARRLLAAGELDAAIREYEQAVLDDGQAELTLLEAGRALASAGRDDDALAWFERSLERDPGSVAANLEAARALARLGRPDPAFERYRRAAELDGTQVPVLLEWARLLAEDGRFDQARQRYERAARHDPSSLEANLGAGRMLVALGRYGDAGEAFSKAVEIDPRSAEAWYLWGRALALEDRLDDARGKLEEAARIQPRAGPVHLALGEVLFDLDDLPRAFESFQRAVGTATAPLEEARARFSLGVAASKLSRTRVAAMQCESAADLLDEADGAEQLDLVYRASLLAGLARSKLGDFRRARVLVARARRIQPFSVQALIAEAFTFRRQGLYQEWWTRLGEVESLLRDARRAGAIDPEYLSEVAGVRVALGRLRQAEKLYEEALTLLESIDPDETPGAAWAETRIRADLAALCLERREHEPDQSGAWAARAREEATRALIGLERGEPEMLLAAGALLLSVGDEAAAESRLLRAIDAGADRRLCEAHLGLLSLQRDDFTLAATHFRSALLLDADDHAVRALLAECYIRLGDLGRAEREYRAILAASPDSIEARVGLGQVLNALGEKDPDAYDQAVEQFEEALRLAQTMKLDPPQREGSTRLTRADEASVYYALGFAQVKLAAARVRKRREFLVQAADSFRSAVERDKRHGNAARALKKVEDVRLPPISDNMKATIFVALIAVALFACGVVFLAVERIDGPSFAVLAGASALMAIAAVSLPELLKLKIGGVELEKASVERVAEAKPIELLQEFRVVRRAGDLSPYIPDLPPSRAPQTPMGEEPPDAAKGAEVKSDQKSNGS